MDIRELKQKIESNTFKPEFMILHYHNSDFVCNQYIDYIRKNLNYTIEYLQDISSLYDDFFVIDPQTIYVYKCSKLDFDVDIASNSNLIIMTETIDKKYQDYLKPYIIEIPDLDSWMIKDYVYSLLPEVKSADLDWLIDICNNDIYRLDNEIQKLKLFDKKYINTLFSDFVREGVFSDLSSYTIFNLSNALQTKDLETIKNILKDIKNIDVEPVGLITIMYQNIKKLIMVWLNPNPTPENTGLKSNQIYAIKKLPRVYSSDQLISLFLFLTKLDYKLKIGEIPTEYLIDYIIITFLTI